MSQELFNKILEDKKVFDEKLQSLLIDLNALGLNTQNLQPAINSLNTVFKDLKYFTLLEQEEDEFIFKFKNLTKNLNLLVYSNYTLTYYCKSEHSLSSCNSLLLLPPEFRELGEQFLNDINTKNIDISIKYKGDMLIYSTIENKKQTVNENLEKEVSFSSDLEELEYIRNLETGKTNSVKFSHNNIF